MSILTMSFRHTEMTPAQKRALEAKRQRTLIAVLAGVPAVVYVGYRVVTFIQNI